MPHMWPKAQIQQFMLINLYLHSFRRWMKNFKKNYIDYIYIIFDPPDVTKYIFFNYPGFVICSGDNIHLLASS